MDKDNKAIELLIQRGIEDGVATAKIDDGRVVVFGRDKLVEILKMLNAENKQHCLILIKETN